MGQNNFVLMGVLEINSEKTKKLGEFDDLSYLHAFIHSGRREDGEIHPVLITGDAAKIAYAAFEKRPKGAIGFLAVGHGSFKSFDTSVLPVIHFLAPLQPNNWMLKLAGWIE